MRILKTTVSSAVLLMVVGCAATSYQSTWKAPDATAVDVTGKKVLVVASNVTTAARRSVETAVAGELNKIGAVASPSFDVLPSGTTVEAAKAKLEVEGYDAAFVVRLTNREQELSSTPGMYAPAGMYGSYWGWGGGAGYYAAPEIRTDIKVYIETLVYSVKRDALVWSGMSVTTNPGNVDKSAAELTRVAIAEMKKSGLLN